MATGGSSARLSLLARLAAGPLPVPGGGGGPVLRGLAGAVLPPLSEEDRTLIRNVDKIVAFLSAAGPDQVAPQDDETRDGYETQSMETI